MTQLFQGRSIAGGLVEGEAIISRQGICFMGGIDPNSGAVSEVAHELRGKEVTDKILVLHSHKGSASGMWAMYLLKQNGLAPKAIIMPKADAIVIAAVIMGKIPAIDGLDFDPLEKFKDGDKLRVDGDKGTVELMD